MASINALRPPRDTTYAAFYCPWIRVFASHTADWHRLVPSTGHVTGIYARVNVERGVHKPPANEVVRGIVTRDLINSRPLEFTLGKREHDILNPRGVYVIRDFRSEGRNIRVFGARTMSSDSMWKYISVRRLFIFIEQSIDHGTRWVVSEPNSDPTWSAIRTFDHGVSANRLEQRCSNGSHAGPSVLRQMRSRHDDPGRHRQRAADLPDRHSAG